METDNNNYLGGVEASTSRRALLKGAVAAGVGAAVYSAPKISVIPAYATHGLASVTVIGDQFCMWFSPNHQSDLGDWHGDDTDHPSVTAAIFGDHEAITGTGPFTFSVPVAGSSGGPYAMEVENNPNHHESDTQQSTFPGPFDDEASTVDGWIGGGVRLKLIDPTCEIEVLEMTCKSKCKADGTNPDPPVYQFPGGSSFSPINSDPFPGTGTSKIQGGQDVYYHSGRRDHDGSKKRCKLGIRFRVNCHS